MATETVTIDFNATFFSLGLDFVASFGNSAVAFSEESDSDLLHAAPKRPIDDDDADPEDDEEEDDDLEEEDDEDEDLDDDDDEEDEDEEDENEDDDEEEEDEDVDELRVSSRR